MGLQGGGARGGGVGAERRPRDALEASGCFRGRDGTVWFVDGISEMELAMRHPHGIHINRHEDGREMPHDAGEPNSCPSLPFC